MLYREASHDRTSCLPVEEWSVRETGLHLDILAQTESIFALSNGHIGLRGNLDEGEPHGLPGTYSELRLRTAPICPTQRADTPILSPGRPSSMSPTANSSACLSTTNPLTFATARSRATSGNSTCATACSAAASAGPHPRGARSRSRPYAWCRSRSGPSRPSATRSRPLMPRCVSSSQSELVANEALPYPEQ